MTTRPWRWSSSRPIGEALLSSAQIESRRGLPSEAPGFAAAPINPSCGRGTRGALVQGRPIGGDIAIKGEPPWTN